jgi:hypothetical protein
MFSQSSDSIIELSNSYLSLAVIILDWVTGIKSFEIYCNKISNSEEITEKLIICSFMNLVSIF